MPSPLLIPIVVVTAAMTVKSDTAPVTVYVKKPRGTLYWGGAGLDGPYIQPQLQAFRDVGIKNVYAGLTNTATSYALTHNFVGTIVDAARAGLTIRFEDSGQWTIASGMQNDSTQFNLIGYSYGSLLAAQTANFYAKQGHVVDNLVLIGYPIEANFLAKLKSTRNIKKVVIINLKEVNDPLYAGMSQLELMESIPHLGKDMLAGKGEGHFYYGHVVSDSSTRWRTLAQRIYSEGLR